MLRKLVDMQYRRNDLNLVRGTFRVRGDMLEFVGVDEELVHRIEFFGDEIEAINVVNLLTGEYVESKDELLIFPAKHFITPEEKLRRAVARSRSSSTSGSKYFREHGKLLEAQRLEMRTRYDLDMLREVGYCNGVENYSRHLTGREPGSTPWCLLDFFPEGLAAVRRRVARHVAAGARHVRAATARANSAGRTRFPSAERARQPSAHVRRVRRACEQVVYVSATPGTYEMGRSAQVVEMIIRPTGLVDPEVEVRPTRNQVDDLMEEIRGRAPSAKSACWSRR